MIASAVQERQPRVRFCCWCRTVTIYAGRADDHVSVQVSGDTRLAMINAVEVTVQDGACEVCAARLKTLADERRLVWRCDNHACDWSGVIPENGRCPKCNGQGFSLSAVLRRRAV